MKKALASLILKILGWKIVGNIPENTPKCVVMMAPHTSNIDFFFGWLGYLSLGYSSSFLIKKETLHWETATSEHPGGMVKSPNFRI